MVRFATNRGNIDVTLTPDAAPKTVANFLNYVNSGAYTNTIIHRSVQNFVLQGGGYALINGKVVNIPQDAPVVNEFNVSNTVGTIAMAKLGNDPNSATNQWFFNLTNNGSNLDNQNGGFTVFGKISNNTSSSVLFNSIANLPIVYDFNDVNLGFPFDSVPAAGYNGTFTASNFVVVSSILPVPNTSLAGFASAASFSPTGNAGVSPGELLTIFGSGLGPANLTTLTLDSKGVVTNSLGGTQVLFDGTPGAMIFTSQGQLSVVAPYNLAGKSTTRIVIQNNDVPGAAIQIPVVDANPGIFTLNASGKGDAAIVRLDGSIVSTSSPASPGETLLLFGEGYGVASPALADGAVVGTTLPIPTAPTTLLIDGKPVPTGYAGGAPSLINGVLQVNFVVPQLAPGSHSIQIQVGQRQSPAGVNLQTK